MIGLERIKSVPHNEDGWFCKVYIRVTLWRLTSFARRLKSRVEWIGGYFAGKRVFGKEEKTGVWCWCCVY